MFVLTTLLIMILSFLTVGIYLKKVKEFVTPEDASPKQPISVKYHFTKKVSNFIQPDLSSLPSGNKLLHLLIELV